ncbi:RabGAP/TBC [Atractiella rhizophila]|nr:RabGAP/TBC [Atractiella rhizophila]
MNLVAQLRKLAWSGIPNQLRPICWTLLLNYLPPVSSRRVSTLQRKRKEYLDYARLAFSRPESMDQTIWHQIKKDAPRTHANKELWRQERTQRSLERILYIWAIRHPASGYVQGINDLVTPFFEVFLSNYVEGDLETFDMSDASQELVDSLEADSFWCLSKLLDGIQDNYIFAQPGIQRQVKRMKELCARVDAPLAAHLESEKVEFIQFAFRWMNCLLMRELSVKNIVRMWDTYLAEGGDAFSEFHLYVCLAFLVRWSEKLREMDFQGIIMFLQSLPTQDWNDENTELLLSEAFVWKSLFHNTSHMANK